MQYVYILQSKVDKYLYVGCTNNLKKRMILHNSCKIESTRNRIPLTLIYYEAYHNKDDAYEREKYMKTGWGKRYIKKILFNYLHS
ncbi:GIY-YIG nuclease family protein [Patescibacteria group bacterium]|nr:GIY-YIG nuclease family protein [Patescibacteria group bacterium]